MLDVSGFINEYTKWLSEEIAVNDVGEYFEITAPYLDVNNDYIQFYVRQNGDDVLFSDDGSTLHKLEMEGVLLTPQRKELLSRILLQYGVGLKDDCLVASAPVNKASRKKHSFIQAMLHVEDMAFLSRNRVSSLFIEDVQDYFTSNKIYFAERVQFTGISGYTHNYDFLLQRSDSRPERLCQTVNRPDKGSVGSIIFAWTDTRPERSSDSRLVVILNDQERIPESVITALKSYDISVILWSERNLPENLELLSTR